MENLIIPQMSAVGVCIIIVCAITAFIKSVTPWKRLYVWLPFILSVPMAIALCYAENALDFENILVRMFSICAGAMASYDIVHKTLKGWRKNIEDDEKEDNDNATNSP